MMRMRLRTVRKAVISIAILFFTICLYLYIYAGDKENRITEPDRKQLVPLTRPEEVENRVDPPQVFEPKTKGAVHSSSNDIWMDAVLEELEFANRPGGAWKQGFPITYNMSEWEREPLEVFLVPHSHQDPGWIYTIDEYFEQKTRRGLSATLKVLEQHPEARFIYAEMSFFNKWVDRLTEHEKQRVRNLLHNGQLEIVSGGWVMTDEAGASYYAMVDQMIEGHQWLWEQFAYRPNMSWSIDPFGHSTTMAYLARKMGFHAMVVGRVHYEVKKYLALRRALEFHWQQQWDATDQPQIPCHMLAFYAYDVPHTCGPDPSVCCQFDFLRLEQPICPWKPQPQRVTPQNVAERTLLLIDQYRQKAQLYNPRGVLLVPLGDDFRFLSEHEWDLQLNNYNQIIHYLDRHPELRVKLRFATLSDYFRAFYRRYGLNPRGVALHPPTAGPDNKLDLPMFTGDLFTYADRDHDYWSGYFTSRPAQKLITRALESELRSAELLYTYAQQAISSVSDTITLASTARTLYDRLTEARRSLGLFQHHDGVTGTAKPHVVTDYSRRLLKALDHCRFVSAVSATALLLMQQQSSSGAAPDTQGALNVQQIGEIIHDLTMALADPRSLRVTLRSLEDVYSESAAPVPSELKLEAVEFPIPIVVFNPLPQPRTTVVTLDLSGLHESFEVSVPHWAPSQPQPADIVVVQVESPDADNEEHTSRVRVGPIHLAPMSLTLLVLQSSDGSGERSVLVSPEPPSSLPNSPLLWLTSQSIRLGFDSHTGFLKYVFDLRMNLVLAVNLDFMIYRTNNENSKSKSGAYLFIADSPAEPMELPLKPKIRVLRGPLVQEITVYTTYVNHTVRLIRCPSLPSDVVEIENTVNLNHFQPQNVELVMRIQSNVTNVGREFYTDSNCFQFVRRLYYDKIPLQGNLYSMTCGVFIQSEPKSIGAGLASTTQVHRLNLFSTYSHGVTSPSPGALHVWLDRRTSTDDDRGLGAPLTGNWVARSTFRLLAEVVPLGSLFQPGGAPVLTGTATAVLTDLLRPIQRFVADHHISPHMSPPVLQLMPNYQMPPGYELVSLKTFRHRHQLFKPFSDSRGTQIGLILRRLPNPPPILSPNGVLHVPPTQTLSEIHISRMFTRLNRTRVVRTPLTMVPAAATVQQPLSTVTLRPMELDAYLLVV